eukprot:3595250-Rhodomonas_salina.2
MKRGFPRSSVDVSTGTTSSLASRCFSDCRSSVSTIALQCVSERTGSSVTTWHLCILSTANALPDRYSGHCPKVETTSLTRPGSGCGTPVDDLRSSYSRSCEDVSSSSSSSSSFRASTTMSSFFSFAP